MSKQRNVVQQAVRLLNLLHLQLRLEYMDEVRVGSSCRRPLPHTESSSNAESSGCSPSHRRIVSDGESLK